MNADASKQQSRETKEEDAGNDESVHVVVQNKPIRIQGEGNWDPLVDYDPVVVSDPLKFWVFESIATPDLEADARSVIKLQWILEALSKEPVDDQSITTVFQVHGYRMDIFPREEGSAGFLATISFRIKMVRHCDWISGKIMSVDGGQKLGDLMSYAYRPSLRDAGVDYMRFQFRITNHVVFDQLHIPDSKLLEIELNRHKRKWRDVETVRGPRSNPAKPNEISTAHLSKKMLDRKMREMKEEEDRRA